MAARLATELSFWWLSGLHHPAEERQPKRYKNLVSFPWNNQHFTEQLLFAKEKNKIKKINSAGAFFPFKQFYLQDQDHRCVFKRTQNEVSLNEESNVKRTNIKVEICQLNGYNAQKLKRICAFNRGEKTSIVLTFTQNYCTRWKQLKTTEASLERSKRYFLTSYSK